MNGLIELLAFKAGGEIAEDRYGLFSLRLTEEEIQDFAVMVIEECARWFDYNGDLDELKKHFGVE